MSSSRASQRARSVEYRLRRALLTIEGTRWVARHSAGHSRQGAFTTKECLALQLPLQPQGIVFPWFLRVLTQALPRACHDIDVSSSRSRVHTW